MTVASSYSLVHRPPVIAVDHFEEQSLGLPVDGGLPLQLAGKNHVLHLLGERQTVAFGEHIRPVEHPPIRSREHVDALAAGHVRRQRVVRRDDRVGRHPIDQAFPVNLAADLGYTDSCSWWGWQETYDGLRVVDFYEADNQPIQHYIDWIKSRPYLVNPRGIFLPHDAKAKSLQTGKSIIEQFLAAGIRPNIVPEMSLQDGIEAARLILPRCWFDEEACYDGIEHLRAYMREFDEKTQTYRSRPRHDQHSHAADAFRYLALAARTVVSKSHRQHKMTSIVKPGAHYAFALNDIWDTAPTLETRVG